MEHTVQLYTGVAFVAIGFFYLFMKLATMQKVSGELAVAVLQLVAFLTVGAYFLLSYKTIPQSYTQLGIIFLVVAGLAIGIGNFFIFKAFGAGPVHIVSPIVGMAIVIPAVAGLLFLGEHATVRSGLGLALAVVSIYLLTSG